MRTQKYRVGQEMTNEALAWPKGALAARKRMTETMMRCGTVIWPTAIEGPDGRDEARQLTRWSVRFEVAHG